MKKLQIFTFDGITSMSLHAPVFGFGGEYFIFTDIDFQSVLYFNKKGGMAMFAAGAHKEDWRSMGRLKAWARSFHNKRKTLFWNQFTDMKVIASQFSDVFN